MNRIEEIRIVRYTPDKKKEWDLFVEKSNNGTMFHKQAFLDYHEPGKFNFQHLMFYQGNDLIGVLPGGLSADGKKYWSPTGASYGSIVAEDIPFSLALRMVDALIDYANDNKWEEIFLIPPPIIYNKYYNQHFEYAMLYRNFDFEYHYISHAIDLKKGDIFEDFDKKTQKIIEKIQRDGKLSIRENKDYASFYPILEENKAKHGVKPTHSLADLLKLEELIPEHLKLFMIYHDDKPVAGSLLFLPNSKVALCFYIMLLYEYKQMKPVFLGNYEAALWAQRNGYEWFDIGVSQDTSSDNPMTPSEPLIYFKERFHARGLLRTTFHYKTTR